jgi:hypothetical protein
LLAGAPVHIGGSALAADNSSNSTCSHALPPCHAEGNSADDTWQCINHSTDSNSSTQSTTPDQTQQYKP